MKKLAAACALASLTFAAGCGSDSSGTTATATSSSEVPQTSSAAAPTSSSGSGAPTVLTGTVGTTDDPDAFVISLTDSSGQPVTTLPAGDYSVQVQDLSEMHNFHLSGGTVDETTTVPEVVDTTFDVTLTAGEYTFQCDPHAKMTGTFTVT
jgi:plastocyanin